MVRSFSRRGHNYAQGLNWRCSEVLPRGHEAVPYKPFFRFSEGNSTSSRHLREPSGLLVFAGSGAPGGSPHSCGGTRYLEQRRGVDETGFQPFQGTFRILASVRAVPLRLVRYKWHTASTRSCGRSFRNIQAFGRKASFFSDCRHCAQPRRKCRGLGIDAYQGTSSRSRLLEYPLHPGTPFNHHVQCTSKNCTGAGRGESCLYRSRWPSRICFVRGMT